MRTALLAATFLSLSFALPVTANLVVNGDFGSGNTAFTSSFVYNPVVIGVPETYAVVTNPLIVHSFAASYGDHTSGSGLMMAVNGTTTPPRVVWSQTVPVTPHTLYEFSVWTSTWFSSGSLSLRVLSETLGSVFATPPGTSVWELTSRTWNSGPATSAVLEIINDSGDFTGNDFALDDISFEAVPEPASVALLGMLGLVLGMRRRVA